MICRVIRWNVLPLWAVESGETIEAAWGLQKASATGTLRQNQRIKCFLKSHHCAKYCFVWNMSAYRGYIVTMSSGKGWGIILKTPVSDFSLWSLKWTDIQTGEPKRNSIFPKFLWKIQKRNPIWSDKDVADCAAVTRQRRPLAGQQDVMADGGTSQVLQANTHNKERLRFFSDSNQPAGIHRETD